MVLKLYIIVVLLLSVYSYALIDPNLTLLNHPLWNSFSKQAIHLGYYQRKLSWYIYLILLLLLFSFHHIFLKRNGKYSPIKIASIISIILFFSYPFLSHDFFNYIFDAKILTFYGENPYLKKPLDFPQDDLLRFMHWTHRTYPYGPTFLGISIIPSFLSFGKFILSYAFFKLMSVGFYLACVYYLEKTDKKIALQFATHPLVVLECLVNLHNDLLALSLGLIFIYYLTKNRVNSWILLILSVGIKYITVPLVLLLVSKSKRYVITAIVWQFFVLIYLAWSFDIQPWYFMSILVYLPFIPNLLSNLHIFFLGLLLSYYPFIALGEWNESRVALKHNITYTFLALNILYMLFIYLRKHRKGNFSLGDT